VNDRQDVLPGFPEPVVFPADAPQSYTRRLTARNEAMLRSGKHPATGRPLANNGMTCNTCANRTSLHKVATYHKCALVPVTGGPATDIRLSWPACDRWSVRPLTEAKS
jgi:hypothetical protein